MNDNDKKKKSLFVLNCGKSNPLTDASDSNSVIVYSYLVYRFGRNPSKAFSARKIESSTRVCHKIVAKSLQTLERLGLVQGSDEGWTPLKPQEEWFVQRKSSRAEWYDQFAYFKVEIPGVNSGLTSRQNLIYWSMVNAPGQRMSYYSLKTGISYRTTTDAVKKLQKLGLIDSNRRPLPRSVEHLALWEDGRTKKKVLKPKFKTYSLSQDPDCKLRIAVGFNFEVLQDARGKVDRIGNSMLAANYKRDEIIQFWNSTIVGIAERDPDNAKPTFAAVIFNFPAIFQHVEKITATNRALDEFSGRNSLELLNIVMRDAFSQLSVWRGEIEYWSWTPPS